MSQVYKCDACGKYEPISIRRIVAENPQINNSPLNKEKYYAFNLFNGEFCDKCLHEIERAIANKIYELKEQKTNDRLERI